MIIDAWAQIPTPQMAEAPWLDSLKRWNRSVDQPMLVTVDSTMDQMDSTGIELALLSAWYGPEGPLISNEQVATQIDQHPDRFRGLASVDLRNPMEAVRDIRRWVDGDRFVGVRLLPWLWDLPPDDRRFYPVYVACIELGVPFCTQIGHTGPLMRSEPGRLIPYIENVLIDFPELVVVGGHVGFPWINELASLMFKFPNLYVDTSAYVLHRLPPEFVHLMKGVGRDRVMFGSNWPMIAPARCLEKLERLGLSDQQTAAFLAGTAQRVFRLGSGAPPPDSSGQTTVPLG